jgi:hypothetical protein
MCDIFTGIWKRVSQEVITFSWLWFVTQSVAHMCCQCSTKFIDSLIWNWVRVELLCEITETAVEALFRILAARLLHQLTISSTKYKLQTNRICFYCHMIVWSCTDWIVGVWL